MAVKYLQTVLIGNNQTSLVRDVLSVNKAYADKAIWSNHTVNDMLSDMQNSTFKCAWCH